MALRLTTDIEPLDAVGLECSPVSGPERKERAIDVCVGCQPRNPGDRAMDDAREQGVVARSLDGAIRGRTHAAPGRIPNYAARPTPPPPAHPTPQPAPQHPLPLPPDPPPPPRLP